jgi:tetratricopeptide (TPR) repeat protein
MRRRYLGFILIAALLAAGCAGPGTPLRRFMDAPIWWQVAQADTIRERARTLEATGELAQALAHWQLVRQITFGKADTAAALEIERIEKTIAEAAEAHYRQGIDSQRNYDESAAKHHFLAALRLDPTFQPALRQIKAKYSPFPLTVYHCRDGEHPADVAEAVFGSRNKAHLVAWFNDVADVDAVLPTGTLLILPKSADLPIVPRTKKPPLKPPDLLATAKHRYAVGDLDGALALAKRVDADTQGVQPLIHAIRLKQAIAAIDAGELDTADTLLAAVPDDLPEKKRVQTALQNVRRRRQKSRDLDEIRADIEDGRFQEGLDHAESLVAAQPKNDAARRLATDARYRLALQHVTQRRYLKAREVLASADTHHAASMSLKAKVAKQLLKMAQIHYRNGVKHYINEKLEAAINEWEQALQCNPEHEKARENIDNARHLLKKIENMQ